MCHIPRVYDCMRNYVMGVGGALLGVRRFLRETRCKHSVVSGVRRLLWRVAGAGAERRWADAAAGDRDCVLLHGLRGAALRLGLRAGAAAAAPVLRADRVESRRW